MAKRLHSILFFLVIFLAIFLRFKGIYPSFPPYHPDEGMSYEQGIYIIKEGTIDAHGYSLALAYPSLIPIINALAFKFFFIPISWDNFFLSNATRIFDGLIKFPLTSADYNRIFRINILGPREIYVLTWGRMVAAGFGVGVVILIYFLSREMFGKNTAIITALLVAINYRQVLNSHIDLPDIYNAFYLILSIIFSYRLVSNRRKIDYLLAGIFVGLSVATKFHIYAVVGFVASYLISIFVEKISLRKIVFSYNFFIAALAGLIIFLLINPYHFVHLEQTISELADVSRKYGVGRFRLNPYPYWYLFNLGIGRITCFATLIGALVMFAKKPLRFLLLGSVIGSFFYFITFATDGGFYTRNFVTITPLILVVPGYFLSFLLEERKKYLKIVGIFIFIILCAGLFIENFSRSIIVANEYSKQWDYTVLENWMNRNIPSNSKVSAHSSILIDDPSIQRLSYDDPRSYSMSEFKKDGANFSVTNFDWVTNSYYDWMNSYTFYWSKPVASLETQYTSRATEELADYSIYSVIKPALAPESDFIVSKIPNFNVSSKVMAQEVNGIRSNNWESKPINIEKFNGIMVDGELKNGYLYIDFYKSLNDTSDVTKRIATRVSGREKDMKIDKEEIITQIPEGAKWMIVGFSNYKVDDSVISDLIIYNANVSVDFGGYKIQKVSIPKDVLFPNSQSNL